MGIAAVTAVLKGLLNTAVAEAGLATILGGDIAVTSMPPDRISTTGAADPNQLNVYLFQTTYNAGWRNAEQPSRNADGDRITNPPLALNLHYLVSAYGSQDYFSEILLGHAMQIFSECSVVPRALIDNALKPATGLPKELGASGLSTQVEQIKITPEVLDAEMMSRFWTALQAHYRSTVAYQVSVVLIQPVRTRKASLPVTSRMLTTVPFPNIVVDTVAAADGGPIVAGATLSISGSGLRGDDTRIQIDDVLFTPAAANVGPTQITLALTTLPAGFHAGVKALQIVHEIPLGAPPTSRPIFSSNVAAIVLRPTVTASVSGSTLTLVFNPKIGNKQKLEVLLNEYQPPANRSARAYSFGGPANNGIADPAVTETDTVNVAFTNIIPADYLVRVRVDGAESALGMMGAVFATPRVTI